MDIQITEADCLFRLNRFLKCEQLLDKIIEHSDQDNKFLINKAKYKKAAVCFEQERYTEAKFIIENLEELKKDREGYRFGVETLRIYTAIALGETSLADSYILNVVKYGYQSINCWPKRWKAIIGHLHRLYKGGYMFDQVYKDFDLPAWISKGPEMIVFEDWYLSNCTKGFTRFTG